MIKQIMENLKDPKKKSLTLFGIYGIFFIFVFIVLNFGSSDVNNYSSNSDKSNTSNDSVSSYEYIYQINNNGNIVTINGIHKDLEDIFTYNGINYYKKNTDIFLNNSELTKVDNIDFNVDKFKYSNMQVLLKNSDLINETKYNDNSKKINYELVISTYFGITGDPNSCDVSDCSISIPVIVESHEYINRISFDMSNYYGYPYNIDISYSNINNIKELKISTN